MGRVLVHGETEAGGTIVTEPVNAETTVEGHVYSRLVAAGVAEEIRHTAQLALLLRMDESTAAEVAAFAQAIQSVADAYRESAEVLGQTLSALGKMDGRAWADAMVEAARDHARNRHQGMDADAAQELFIEAALRAWAEGGADPDAVVLATAGAGTGLDRAMTVADENAQLDLAKNAVQLNLSARSELTGELPESTERSAAFAALASAEARVEASASVGELTQVLLNTEQEAEDALIEAVMSRLSNVPENVRADIQARLETAFATADLSARLRASSGAGEIVQAVLDYRQAVRAAVEEFVAELPPGAGIQVEATADLLLAVVANRNRLYYLTDEGRQRIVRSYAHPHTS